MFIDSKHVFMLLFIFRIYIQINVAHPEMNNIKQVKFHVQNVYLSHFL
jgi:hypothetical protein